LYGGQGGQPLWQGRQTENQDGQTKNFLALCAEYYQKMFAHRRLKPCRRPMTSNDWSLQWLIRPARAHGSPAVRTGRTHGPDEEKALHDKLFRMAGAHWPFNQKSCTPGPGTRVVHPGRASGHGHPGLSKCVSYMYFTHTA